jgi:hypothetical protein
VRSECDPKVFTRTTFVRLKVGFVLSFVKSKLTMTQSDLSVFFVIRWVYTYDDAIRLWTDEVGCPFVHCFSYTFKVSNRALSNQNQVTKKVNKMSSSSTNQSSPARGPSSAIFHKIVQSLAPGSPPGTNPKQENTITMAFQNRNNLPKESS